MPESGARLVLAARKGLYAFAAGVDGTNFSNGTQIIDTAGNIVDPSVSLSGNVVLGTTSSNTLTINSTTTVTGTAPIQFVNASNYISSTSTGTIGVVAASNINLTVGGNTITVSGSGMTGAITILATQTQTTATPGTIRTIIGSNTAFTSTTSGTLVGVRGVTNIPDSSTVSAGVYMYGTQGKLIAGTTGGTGSVTINATSGHICGVLGQIDISNATLTSGHVAGLISSVQDSSNAVRSQLNGVYVELPAYGSGAKANAVIQGFGSVDYIGDYSGNHVATSMFNVGSELVIASTVSTGGVHIPFIKVGATQYYINAYTS